MGSRGSIGVSASRDGVLLRHSKTTVKGLNSVAALLSNQLFRTGKQEILRCGSTGVGVIDFADVEEESLVDGILGHQLTSDKKNEMQRRSALRSPKNHLQRMVPNSALQHMQMDLILLDECPTKSELKQCAWKGCSPKNRAQVWRMLLDHEPLLYSKRAAALASKRDLYNEYVNALCAPEGVVDVGVAAPMKQYPISSRNENETSVSSTSAKSADASGNAVKYSDFSVKTLRQIEMDLPRTHPNIPIFHVGEVRNPMRRILYVFGMLHPNKNYVQGMNELLTPILVVFLSSYLNEATDRGLENFLNREDIGDDLSNVNLTEAEADAYWTFSLLVTSVEDNFIADQPGILRRIARLEDIVSAVDPLLRAHLARNGNEFIQFSFRWMNCLLMRELPFTVVVKVWDALLAEEDGMADLHVYFCAAMMIHFRAELLSKGFEECIMFLQHLPTSDWNTGDVDVLLSQALLWKDSLQLPSLAL